MALELPFLANPQPSVAWEHNGKAVSLSRRVTRDTIRNMSSLCVGHVVLDDAGTYTCRLENQYGRATLNIHVTVKGKPSAPQNLSVTKITENGVTLEWEEPKTDGGSSIKGYIVEKRDPHRRSYTHLAGTRDTHQRVVRLSPGAGYVFQVSAENSVGIGDPAEISVAIPDKSQLGKYSSTLYLHTEHIPLFSQYSSTPDNIYLTGHHNIIR